MLNQNRQLAAILFTDIVGYTAMMQVDEQKAVAVTNHYITVLNQSVEKHHGKVLNDYGDGSLCTFPSVTDALYCAIEIQQQLQAEPKVPLRIGLHSGEVFFEGNKVMGDSVNVASRIQSLGQANTILFSKEIGDKIKNQIYFKCISLGKFEFKNVDEPIEIFALANEGLIIPSKEHMSGKLKEIQNKSSRRNWIFTAAMVILLVAAFFIYKYFYSTPGFNGEKSIAVLPFDNYVKGDIEEYINDGITQDIINNLSKISSLQKVIGWFSVREYKNTKKRYKQIAEELSVSSILMGNIQRQGDKIKVFAELLDVSTGKQLWFKKNIYDSKDLLSIQTNVASEIANALQANLTPEEKKGISKHYTENVNAYKLYLKGRSFSDDGNTDSAIVYYKMAKDLEPDYALAYAGLADCYRAHSNALDHMAIAINYVEKALSLDSTLSEALTTKGFIQQVFDYDWQGARKNLEKAINFGPNNVQAHMVYGLVLMHSTPEKERALTEMQKAVELNPIVSYPRWVLARNYYFVGKYDLAIKQLNLMNAISPSVTPNTLTNWSLGLIYLKQNLFSKAKEMFDQLPESKDGQLDNFQLMQSYGYAVMGDKPKAKKLLEETLKKYFDLSHYRISQVYVALGNFNEAMNQLELGYTNRDVHMFWIKVDPAFDPIRNEPMFKALIKKMNLE